MLYDKQNIVTKHFNKIRGNNILKNADSKLFVKSCKLRPLVFVMADVTYTVRSFQINCWTYFRFNTLYRDFF